MNDQLVLTDEEIRQSIKQAASDGAQLLDEKHPGWAHELRGITLNMQSIILCVLARLYGGYNVGVLRLGISFDDVYRYGFDLPKALYDDEHWWPVLTQAWQQEVMTRNEALPCNP